MGNVNKNIGRLLVAVGVLMILGLQGVRSEYGDLAGNWLVDYDRDELNFLRIRLGAWICTYTMCYRRTLRWITTLWCTPRMIGGRHRHRWR